MTLVAGRRGNEIVCGRPRCRGPKVVLGYRVGVLTIDSVRGEAGIRETEHYDFEPLGTYSKRHDTVGDYFEERPYVEAARRHGYVGAAREPYHRRPSEGVRRNVDPETAPKWGAYRAEDLPIRARCRNCGWLSWITTDILA